MQADFGGEVQQPVRVETVAWFACGQLEVEAYGRRLCGQRVIGLPHLPVAHPIFRRQQVRVGSGDRWRVRVEFETVPDDLGRLGEGDGGQGGF